MTSTHLHALVCDLLTFFAVVQVLASSEAHPATSVGTWSRPQGTVTTVLEIKTTLGEKDVLVTLAPSTSPVYLDPPASSGQSKTEVMIAAAVGGVCGVVLWIVLARYALTRLLGRKVSKSGESGHYQDCFHSPPHLATNLQFVFAIDMPWGLSAPANHD